jgi:hypothetical protein
VPVAAGGDTKAPPLEQVQKMDAGAYFGRLARLMQDNPQAPADGPMVEKLKTLGIEPEKDFDINTIDPHTAKGLPRAMGAFEKLQEGVKKLKTANGWIVMPKAAQVQLKDDRGSIGGLRVYRRFSWLKRATQTTGLLCGAGPRLVGCAQEARVDRGEHHERGELSVHLPGVTRGRGTQQRGARGFRWTRWTRRRTCYEVER